MADCTNPDDFGLCAGDYAAAQTGGDTIGQAAIRALGINPVPNADGSYSYLPAYDPNGPVANTDATEVATKAAASASTYYNSQLTANQARLNKANQDCGGFLADLLNPFSPNVDPSQWNCKAANALKGINWTAVVALAIVLAILATVHQVKEIV